MKRAVRFRLRYEKLRLADGLSKPLEQIRWIPSRHFGDQNMIKAILRTIVVVVAALGNTTPSTPQTSMDPQVGKPVIIPARFAANRIFATPVTSENVTLNLFTDSAGVSFLFQDTADRLKLKATTVEGDNGKPLTVAFAAII